MLERDVEKALRKGVEALGGECMKFVSPGRRGVPDRIVVWPGGEVHFIELKQPKGRLSALQHRTAYILRQKAAVVYTLVSLEDVTDYLDDAKSGMFNNAR